MRDDMRLLPPMFSAVHRYIRLLFAPASVDAHHRPSSVRPFCRHFHILSFSFAYAASHAADGFRFQLSAIFAAGCRYASRYFSIYIRFHFRAIIMMLLLITPFR